MLTTDQLSELLFKHLQGELTTEQQETLDLWIAESDNNREFFRSVNDEEQLRNQFLFFQPDIEIITEEAILEKIRERRSVGMTNKSKVVHRVPFLKTAWFRYAAAIIILFGIGAYLWNTQNNPGTLTQTQPVPGKNDVLPGGQRAILKLADGSEIILDSAANGQLASENGSEITKRDGQVIYDAGQVINNGATYNTMSTPNGGQYQLTLIDGTKVWLNAASSITYPTVFNGNTREVKITGEVYLEVAKNKSKPFIVKTNKQEIKVLGTSFNIHAYGDEINKTSLISGAVKINKLILQPGQAYINEKIVQTNIEQDIAWKNGLFNFNNITARQALKQLARWYDVDLVYQANIDDVEFGGKIGRSLTLAQVLEGLEGFGGLHFELKQKTLIIHR